MLVLHTNYHNSICFNIIRANDVLPAVLMPSHSNRSLDHTLSYSFVWSTQINFYSYVKRLDIYTTEAVHQEPQSIYLSEFSYENTKYKTKTRKVKLEYSRVEMQICEGL